MIDKKSCCGPSSLKVGKNREQAHSKHELLINDLLCYLVQNTASAKVEVGIGLPRDLERNRVGRNHCSTDDFLIKDIAEFGI